MLSTTCAGCGGGSETFSADEAKAAFAKHGFELSENTNPDRAGEFLTEGGPYYVLVGTEGEADELWSNDEVSRFARRDNAVVIAVLQPSAGERERALAALEALPESDSSVELGER